MGEVGEGWRGGRGGWGAVEKVGGGGGGWREVGGRLEEDGGERGGGEWRGERWRRMEGREVEEDGGKVAGVRRVCSIVNCVLPNRCCVIFRHQTS